MKVGNFSVSFVDLEVPVAGIPLRITRTYDSRDRGTVGDFGFGWNLDLTQVTVTTTNAPGIGWFGNASFPGGIGTYCLQATQAHPVTVTLPDGKIFEFDPVVTPSCQQFAPIESATIAYQARPGTVGTLVPVDQPIQVDVASSWPGRGSLVCLLPT
jgi:hypothetical protein